MDMCPPKHISRRRSSRPSMGTNTQGSDAPVDVDVDEEVEDLRELSIEYEPLDKMVPNDYNPNRQNEREFKLLLKSIREDGFTQPIVVLPEGEGSPETDMLNSNLHPGDDFDPDDHEKHVIVDGEHRWRAAHKLGLETIPVVAVDMDEAQARVSTLRHNRASGSEDVDLAADVLNDLQDLGALDEATDSLMMDDTEVNRLIEDVSVEEEFADEEFSEAWEPSKGEGKDEEADETSSTDSENVSTTDSASEELREREKRIQEAKDEEEKQMAEDDTDISKYEFIFTDLQAQVVDEVLGDEQASNFLALCVDAYDGPIDTTDWIDSE